MVKKVGELSRLGLFLETHYKTGKIEKFLVMKKLAFRSRLAKIDAKKVDHYYLSVTYAPGVINDGYFYTKEELLKAYRDFTNEEELAFVSQYWS